MPCRSAISNAVLCLTAALCVLAGAAGRAEDRPAVTRAAIEKYLFLPESDTYLIGDRIAKWDSDIAVILYREDERALVEEIVSEILGRKALGRHRIHLLPPIERLRDDGQARPNFTLGVNSAFFEFMMAPGGLRGLEAYQARAKAAGCYAQPTVPLIARDYVITGAQIMTRDDLGTAALRDCLFRGFLLTAGLMYTDLLAFRKAPLGEAERAEALAVLGLLYHPAVRPGMTREAFYAALEAEGLIGR
ncbi:MAG: DUF2927 domain-containing protein [Rhodospirillales bacterium]|nr:DUF2927 domain-containing protein [Rhodospirillales bacterium]MDH3918801.1 DUF2927 domain-containing protein [Rhodospirillales bacterium]MDH3966820.1 DUF2927 domain-containing protein [Rhodospirillales bacterium]